MVYGRYGKYPHMIGAEVDIWDRYLDRYKDDYTHFEYDTHVGTPPSPEVVSRYPLIIQKAILATYLYRIDVVGFRKDNSIEIIEVKDFAGPSALGQVLLYEHLYRRDFKPKKVIKKRIVTDRTTQDIIEFAKIYNITVTALEGIV